jgi:plastocyanin
MFSTRYEGGKRRPNGLVVLGRRFAWAAFCFALLLCSAVRLGAQESVVHGSVRVLHHDESASESGDVVVWLTPLKPAAPAGSGPAGTLMQRGKKFIPHVVAITQGTEIEFPNHDLFFHNVFSIHQGKTFDLGLYESGAVRKVKFGQPGVSYIFCNIHPQMSAVVVVLKTRYFAVTDPDGSFQISQVPSGRYKVVMWYELATEAELKSVEKEVEVVRGDNEISQVVLHSSDAPPEHMNKEGEPYYSSSPKTR